MSVLIKAPISPPTIAATINLNIVLGLEEAAAPTALKNSKAMRSFILRKKLIIEQFADASGDGPLCAMPRDLVIAIFDKTMVVEVLK